MPHLLMRNQAILKLALGRVGPRPTNEEFLENLTAAAEALKDTVPRVLEFIAGKTVREL